MAEKRVPMTMRDFFFDDPFFRSTWEDFDRVREAMFQESRDMWKRFDEDFRNMACMSNNIMLDTDNRGAVQSSEMKSSRQERSSSTSKEVTSSSKEVSSSNKEVSSSNKEVSSSNKEVSNKDNLDRQDSLASRWENGWMFPRRWMLPSLRTEFDKMDLFRDKDTEVIRVKQDNQGLEVSLDTSQYRPDELRVSVNNNIVSIEGKHEEKAEDGRRMVSRQFVRKYSLPQGVRPEEVVSNLSSDGVLVVTAGQPAPALEVKINQQ